MRKVFLFIFLCLFLPFLSPTAAMRGSNPSPSPTLNMYLDEAIKGLEIRTKKRDPQAYYELAMIYRQPPLVEKKGKKEIFDLFQKAILKGDRSLVQKAIPHLYNDAFNSLSSTLPEEQEAGLTALTFLASATVDDGKAQCTLAGLYSEGDIVPYDEDRFLSFCEPALQKNLPEAQHYMAVFLFQKKAKTDKDREKAVDLFKKAAHRGHADAQVTLGLLYALGKEKIKGIEKDLKKAKEWFLKAREQKHPLAQKYLEMVTLPEEKDSPSLPPGKETPLFTGYEYLAEDLT